MTVAKTHSHIVMALIFLGMPLGACAGEYPGDYEIPSFPGDPPPPAGHSAVDQPIESLAADPVAAEVIDRNIPGLLHNRRYPMFKNMSLRTVAALSSGRISRGTLAEIDHELAGAHAEKVAARPPAER